MIIFLSHFMGVPDANTQRRMDVARVSWEREWSANRGQWMNPLLTFTHDSSEIGDPAPVPLVNDLIAQGVKLTQSDSDILLLCNADIGITEGFTQRMERAIDCVGAVFMRRREFLHLDEPIKTRKEVKAGGQYVGGDAFAFTLAWWSENGPIFPKMYLGRYGFDSVLKNMIRRSGGAELPNEIWHIQHDSFWNSTPEVIEKNPANLYNRMCLQTWCEQFGGSPEDHLYSLAELNYR